MQIRSIHVSNFKSLVDFRIDLAKFNCLIGLNGSGKSTVLQLLDFISQLVRGEIKGWLKERKWKSSDLISKLTKNKNTIDFCVFFSHTDNTDAGRWEASFSFAENRCTHERIDLLDSLLETTGDEVEVHNLRKSERYTPFKITFKYEGSILSALKEELLPQSILKCKRFFLGMESLEMLTPERLRRRARTANGSLGHGGRNLSAFLYELGTSGRKDLTERLKEVYPQLSRISTTSIRSGWKQLRAVEKFGNNRFLTEARHLNDGLLRLMAILAELASDHGFIMFDEIENGINPELVEFIIDELTQARQQVLVTTHSPMILNYLDDETAKAGVIYLYKTPKGCTESIPFFSIPSLAEKLTVMGPGEAFVDTDLTQLSNEIAEMSGEEV